MTWLTKTFIQHRGDGISVTQMSCCRSLMNIPFTIPKGAELEAAFLKEATKAGLVRLSCYLSTSSYKA